MMTVRWLREQMRLGKSIYDLPLRVTFYARVSTEKVEQQGSLENQIQYYTEFIQKNPNWTYIPGYIDEGISGTSTYKRDSFLRMIADAQRGMFDFIQKQQLVSFPKVRIWKPWFRHFNNHKEFRNEGTVHLFSLMALFSYANFRSNERMISGERYMEAPGQWICKLGSLPRILRVHSKRQALEQLDYYEKYGFLTYEWLDEENEIIRFSITNWKEHCTSLQYNYYSYKGSGFFFFPLPVGRMLLRIAHKTEGIVFSELDAIMDMWLHTILNDPKVRGSEYMPVVYYSNMRGVPLLSYTYLAKRWGWSKSRVGRFMLKAGEYGIISRVSFSSSRGSVISMCRYREMIFGDTCEELELSSIGEIIGITKAADLVDPDEGKMDISIETRVPPAHTIGKPRKALRIQVFLVIQSSFFARQIPLVFYSALDWEVTNQEKNSRDPPTESQSGKEMKR